MVAFHKTHMRSVVIRRRSVEYSSTAVGYLRAVLPNLTGSVRFRTLRRVDRGIPHVPLVYPGMERKSTGSLRVRHLTLCFSQAGVVALRSEGCIRELPSLSVLLTRLENRKPVVGDRY